MIEGEMCKIEYRLDIALFMARLRNKMSETMMVNDLPTLSLLTGASVHALQRYENGIEPPLPVFLRMCSEFDLTPGDYFERIEWVAKSSATPALNKECSNE